MRHLVYFFFCFVLFFSSCNKSAITEKNLPAPPIKSIYQKFYFAYKDGEQIRKVRPDEHLTTSVDTDNQDHYIQYDSLGRVVEEHIYNMFCELSRKEFTKYEENGEKQLAIYYAPDFYDNYLFRYNEKGQLVEQRRYNNDRLVNIETYEEDEEGDIAKINGVRQKETKYDSNGKVLEVRSYTRGGYLSSIQEYIYKDGLLVQTNKQHAYLYSDDWDAKIVHTKWFQKYKSTEYKYDSSDNLLTKIEYKQKKNDVICSAIYTYNSTGNIIEHTSFSDGIKSNTEFYDDSGVLTKRIWYNKEDGTQRSEYDYVYDDKGNPTEVYIDKSLTTRYSYVFDRYGNWTEQTRYNTSGNHPEYIIYRTILYHEK